MPVPRMVDLPARHTELQVILDGDEVDVVLLASALRSASDFRELARRLAEAGWGSAAVNLRGVGASSPADRPQSMRDIAADIAAVIDAVAGRPVHVVGHALGNTFARATAAYQPEAVRSVVLLACGGHSRAHAALRPELLAHFNRCHDLQATREERLESLAEVFFAPGNDPSPWLDGWWPSGSGLSAALAMEEPGEWATAGTAPVLIVQPLNDALASPEVGRDLADQIGRRGRYVELDNCGHAILPEQPDRVSEIVISFLQQQPGHNPA
jgi:pimeloyl-ACP methyl ester carboxylesterase